MTQRISSSSSSAASAAAQSSRQRNKRRVMEAPTLPRKSKRKAQSSSSSLAQQRIESEEPSRKRLRQNGSSGGASLANESGKRRSSSAAAAAATPLPVDSAPGSSRSKNKAKVATDKEAIASPVESKKKKEAPSVKPLEIVSCGICFEESYEHAGVLDCCQHGYCFPCISKWAEENSNTCPQCKRRIRSIRKMNVSTGKRVSTKKIKKRDLNTSSSGSGGMGVINFGSFHLNPPEALHLLLQHVGGGSHDPFMNPLMYHILFQSAADYDDDEDDEDYVVEEAGSDYSEEDVICPCCTFAWDASMYDRCPNCHCTGDHSMNSGDEYYDDEDSDESDRRGTIDNPIELD